MPFPASWIEENIAQAVENGRLGHAFLLSGSDIGELEEVFYKLSAVLLGEDDPEHSDLHILRPESKSRRILVEQIRELERALQLKALRAPRKIACIVSADRMCLGQAEPANAFLKTLEEPPANTVLFLLSDSPERLLPTIRSRCLSLPLKESAQGVENPELDALAEAWFADVSGEPVDTAYRRSALLTQYWQESRQSVEAEMKETADEQEQEEVFKARQESRFLLERERSISRLMVETWTRASRGEIAFHDAERACQSLNELHSALGLNMDQGLAVERCCLKMTGVL